MHLFENPLRTFIDCPAQAELEGQKRSTNFHLNRIFMVNLLQVSPNGLTPVEAYGKACNIRHWIHS